MLYTINMQTFQYVEDYLEFLGGYEIGPSSLIWPTVSDRISLARYDVQIVGNMSSTTVFGTALTDKQADLAVKLILKYRRQFLKYGVDVTPVENPVFRVPLRKINRTKTIQLDGDMMALRFPYDNQMINEIQEFRGLSQGRAKFDRDTKVWYLGVTEYNVNWIVTWGDGYGFTIDQAIRDLLSKIVDCEKTPYKIELVKDDKKYKITNAPKSLVAYIKQQGGFGHSNLVKLIDCAGMCGYDINEEVVEEVVARYGTALHEIGGKHSIHITPSPENLNMIFDYAELTDRYPICIYNPTLFDIDLSRFIEEDIVRFDRNGKTGTSDYDPYCVKVIYAHKIPTTWDFPVPLLVTTFEMMFGGRKMDWTRKAEKIIYYGATQLREQY